MVGHGGMRPDRPEWQFRVWIRDFCRGVCFYFLRIIDPEINYIPEPPPEELEPLVGDVEIVEVDNVDDSITEMQGAGMKERIFLHEL